MQPQRSFRLRLLAWIGYWNGARSPEANVHECRPPELPGRRKTGDIRRKLERSTIVSLPSIRNP